MKLKKYAAIDIGTNAIRLLIANVVENGNGKVKIKKNTLVRVPVRLGEDVFDKGRISDEKIEKLIKTMKAFKLLMEVFEVEDYLAVATSAMREAKNGREVIRKIEKETGIRIEIIDGAREAEFIAYTDLEDLIDPGRNYLYVDVGGGSTEFSVFEKGKKRASKSFKLGTVRSLKDKIPEGEWERARKWVETQTRDLDKVYLIGSGGNINKLYKMSGKAPGAPLSKVHLKALYKMLKSMSYKQRIKELGLNPDRADVIIPASKIYLRAMRWSGGDKIYVPSIGLADGIIKYLHDQHHSKDGKASKR
ncbi:MAG: exopolyphosphatase [Chlorobi bacterium]|nr:exopolyphosphatase [Chlorobiota bacterium]